MLYNPSKDGEFAAIAKKELKKVKVVKYKGNKIKRIKAPRKREKKYYKKDRAEPSSNGISEKSISFTFPKSKRNDLFTNLPSVNENRFGFNPRAANPDPYEITHRKYYLFHIDRHQLRISLNHYQEISKYQIHISVLDHQRINYWIHQQRS